ncbi:hypothetical protein AN161_21905 [Lysinibacillus sp. FJAT-14222]|nr:hypothetical protein AN161_21905 [Lysinibacillus sp. FJAT-14222]
MSIKFKSWVIKHESLSIKFKSWAIKRKSVPIKLKSWGGTKAKNITSCDNAFVTNIMLLLHTDKTILLQCAFAQKISVAAGALSPKSHLLLPQRFRTKNTCCHKRLIERP